METRTFGVLQNITATENQWAKIDTFIKQIECFDIKNEVCFIMISNNDIVNHHIKENFSLNIISRNFPSNELYDAISRHTDLFPEWIYKKELIPDGIIIWKWEK